jgi:hypothetical protein
LQQKLIRENNEQNEQRKFEKVTRDFIENFPKELTPHTIANFFGVNGVGGQIILKNIQFYKNTDSFDSNYKLWKEKMEVLYPKNELNSDLYEKHILLVTIIIFFLNWIYKTFDRYNITLNIEKMLKIPPYFTWALEIQENRDLNTVWNTISPEIIRKEQDLFTELYQSLIADTTRHQMGEFYTHQFLARTMIQDSYHLGDRVLDPACGSGMFLVEITRSILNRKIDTDTQIQALNRITGIDRNPLAVIMTKANLWLVNPYIRSNQVKLDIICTDALIPNNAKLEANNERIQERFDLIIGNPPWVVLNRLSSHAYKQQLKELGTNLGILLGGKLATSTELTTLFISKMLRDYLTLEGCIFFVTPASLATGAQHDKFRQFEGFKQIEFWAFAKDVFKIHNLCFKGFAGNSPLEQRTIVKWKIFNVNLVTQQCSLLSEKQYSPQYIQMDKSGNNTRVGRLTLYQEDNLKENVPHSLKNLVNRGVSSYHRLFKQGASLVPRNLLQIRIGTHLENKVVIVPAETIQSKKYRTWDFKAYSDTEIEADYIYSVAKSTGLLSFFYFQSYLNYLPINPDNWDHPPLKPLALAHYQHLEQIYKENLKEGAQITSLWDRLDYGHALTDPKQKIPLKVIFAGIGSNVKAAIIEKSHVIDTSLYYFCPSSHDEAYFLTGILNSPIITQYVKLVGSTGANGSLRNIHKHPFDLPIPKYDSENSTHIQIMQLSRTITDYVKQFVVNQIRSDSTLQTKLKAIQKRILSDDGYKARLESLDQLVKKELKG